MTHIQARYSNTELITAVKSFKAQNSSSLFTLVKFAAKRLGTATATAEIAVPAAVAAVVI
jgi:hypothetical protein